MVGAGIVECLLMHAEGAAVVSRGVATVGARRYEWAADCEAEKARRALVQAAKLEGVAIRFEEVTA